MFTTSFLYITTTTSYSLQMAKSSKKRKGRRSRNFEAFSSQRSGPRVRRAPYDKFFLGNCFCCDCCVWAPLNPRTYSYRKRLRGTSLPCWRQFTANLYFYLTVVLISTLNGCYLYFDSAFLVEHIGISVTLFFQLNFLITLLSLFSTACTDPGILPPSTDDEARYLERTEGLKN